ncbi:PspC domain-containing protein [Candidatus Saccharibacteria bacterium]|nr:PspC domain-containing protein [Candidatus Saccharibacteria bacterium]
MNEVTRIHLARVAYDIDATAQKELEKYITAVKKSLGSEAEAMEDIEIRMTEILAERGVNKDDVITSPDVAAIIDQLGEPKDFSSADAKAEAATGSSSSAKKYYRDSENGILGGVIAGLAAYTGWDVTLLRIIAVLLLIFSTVIPVLLIYIVVWIAAPEANTVSEKLAMHGEPVNIDSIKQAAEKVGNKAGAMGAGSSGQCKAKPWRHERCGAGYFSGNRRFRYYSLCRYTGRRSNQFRLPIADSYWYEYRGFSAVCSDLFAKFCVLFYVGGSWDFVFC